MHSLKMGVNGILGSDRTIKGIMRSAQMSRESTSGQVTNILLDVQLLVWVVVGHALLWGTQV